MVKHCTNIDLDIGLYVFYHNKFDIDLDRPQPVYLQRKHPVLRNTVDVLYTFAIIYLIVKILF